MRFVCWITKATDIHSEYVILIAFPLQQWLRERASMLRYMYAACTLQSLVLTIYVVLDTFMLKTVCDNEVFISAIV
jgi:hypothetical protein